MIDKSMRGTLLRYEENAVQVAVAITIKRDIEPSGPHAPWGPVSTLDVQRQPGPLFPKLLS
jgi:hypothetical protein